MTFRYRHSNTCIFACVFNLITFRHSLLPVNYHFLLKGRLNVTHVKKVTLFVNKVKNCDIYLVSPSEV